MDTPCDFGPDAFATHKEIEQVETRIVFEYTPTWELPDVEGGE